jgi:hypothetical protein
MTDSTEKFPLAGKVVLSGIGLMVLFGIIGATVGDTKAKRPVQQAEQAYVSAVDSRPTNQTLVGWRTQFKSAFARIQVDWQVTENALAKDDQTGATTGYALLEQDALNLAILANSPDPSLNDYVRTLASDYVHVARIGSNMVNNGSSTLDELQQAVDKVSVDEDQEQAELSGNDLYF